MTDSTSRSVTAVSTAFVTTTPQSSASLPTVLRASFHALNPMIAMTAAPTP